MLYNSYYTIKQCKEAKTNNEPETKKTKQDYLITSNIKKDRKGSVSPNKAQHEETKKIDRLHTAQPKKMKMKMDQEAKVEQMRPDEMLVQ